MFIQGEQGRKAIGLAIMSTTVPYLFSMIYIMPNFKPLTSWMSCFFNNFNNKSGGVQALKKTNFAGTFHWVKNKNKIGLTISFKFTLAHHLYPELVCLSM